MEDVVGNNHSEGGLPLTTFSDETDEATFHFQILKLLDQVPQPFFAFLSFPQIRFSANELLSLENLGAQLS
jgi:hypothetical protein